MKKENILIVVDMQYDFTRGALKNPDAEKIVEDIAKYVREYDGVVIGTRDLHFSDNGTGILHERFLYENTLEGKLLPQHCISGSGGEEIERDIRFAISDKDGYIVNKITFGYVEWAHTIFSDVLKLDVNPTDAKTISSLGDGFIEKITLVGTCTDICVISNALILRAMFPNVKIEVISSLCAGCTPAKHEAALEVMRSCLIDVK